LGFKIHDTKEVIILIIRPRKVLLVAQVRHRPGTDSRRKETDRLPRAQEQSSSLYLLTRVIGAQLCADQMSGHGDWLQKVQCRRDELASMPIGLAVPRSGRP
jgi:hypothetical protein